MNASLPPPSPDALSLSEALTRRFRQRLEAAGGWLPFSDYMRCALQEPGLGYYSAGSAKFGPDGDFVTAPELGDMFARVLARQCARLFEALEGPPRIVEFGAGSGRLAEDLLLALDELGIATDYRIVETSADLAARQRGRLAKFGGRVGWISEWPCAEFEGVVIANEVLDAFPVDCFSKRSGTTRALGVAWQDDHFVWAEREAGPGLSAAVAALERALGQVFADGFRSEYRPAVPEWFASVAAALARGYLLIVDYGLVRREFYHPSRSAGTLMCHYRHRAHADPFHLPGLQDISAWVDFSACADAAAAAGFEIAGFTTQAQFLLNGGMDWRLPASPRLAAEQARALSRLILPGEMGERFKLLLLSRELPVPLGLPGRDLRNRL